MTREMGVDVDVGQGGIQGRRFFRSGARRLVTQYINATTLQSSLNVLQRHS